MISIVTTSYNYEQYIEETIKSVLGQTYCQWEMIIVDDGSTDNSVEVIKAYTEKDPRIKLFTHENNSNKGLSLTLQLGIEKAKGDWIVFLESDDMIAPDYLEKKLEIIKSYPDAGLIYNNCELLAEKEITQNEIDFMDRKDKGLRSKKYPRNMFFEFYNWNNILTFSCVMIKKKLLKGLNYNCPVKTTLDHWLWIQIAYRTKFYYMPDKLTIWRRHDNSYISQTTQRTPKDLQLKIYMKMFWKTLDIRIPFFAAYSRIAWSLRNESGKLYRLVKNKR